MPAPPYSYVVVLAAGEHVVALEAVDHVVAVEAHDAVAAARSPTSRSAPVVPFSLLALATSETKFMPPESNAIASSSLRAA